MGAGYAAQGRSWSDDLRRQAPLSLHTAGGETEAQRRWVLARGGGGLKCSLPPGLPVTTAFEASQGTPRTVTEGGGPRA